MIKQFSKLPLHYRLAVASLLPLLLVIVALAGLSIQTRQIDLNNNIQLMAQTRANFAAKASDLALFSEDTDTLQQIIESTLKIKSTQGVMFLDKNKSELLASPFFALPGLSLEELIFQETFEDQYFYYSEPIFLSDINVIDFTEEFNKPREKNLVGWVVISLDISEQRNQFNKMILRTLVFSGLGFLLALISTYLLSRSILKPLRSLTKTVSKINEGNLSIRAKRFNHPEFSLLADVINRVLDAVEKGKTTLELQVDDAYTKLQSTLDDLQQKNNELEHAREQAERSSQSKTEFLARMSHELRTPITSIQGFAQLLHDSSTSNIDQHHCKIIDQAADQLLLLINDILDYSKLQSNTVTLDNHQFDLIECIEQVAQQFSLQAQEKDLEFTVEFSPSIVANRFGDPKRVRQIVGNLLSNAIKFTQHGGVYITVSEGTDKHTARISVRDTGIGIKKSQQSQLFNAFSQADTSINRQYGGTGLGLTITKTLAELMGGELFFYSTNSQGSDFIAELPLKETTVQAPKNKHSKTVLIYHHSKPAYSAIANALIRLGHQPTSADSTTDEQSGYDAVIYCLPPSFQDHKAMFEQLLSTRNKHLETNFIFLTPIKHKHLLFSTEQLKELNSASVVTTPPAFAALKQALEHISKPSNESLNNPAEGYLNNLNILIAEDNQFTCLLLETFIEKYGGIFTTATNGFEAVKICQTEPFDIILIDVHMPEMNGFQAITKIRNEHGVNTSTPIIALTADLQQQDKRQLLDAGANDMMLKPFKEIALLNTVLKLLGRTIVDTPIKNPNQGLVSETAYLQEISSLSQNLCKYIKSQDWDNAAEIIHQLKGVTGIFKLKALEQGVMEIHQAYKSGNFDELEKLVIQLIKNIPKTC